MMNRKPAAWRVGALAVCAASLFAPRAVGDEPHEREAEHILMRLQPGVDINSIVYRYQTMLDPSDPVTFAQPELDVYVVHLLAGIDEDDFLLLTDHGADPDVLWADDNVEADAPEGTGRNFFLNVTPSAALYLAQPAWTQIGQSAATARSSGAGMIVAVIDSGVDATHPALAGRILGDGWNFVDESSDVSDAGDSLDNDGDGEIDEMTGHGTHITGIITHIAPDAMILPIKVLDSDGNGDNLSIGRAIYYAIEHGATVINMSLGSTAKPDLVEDAVYAARAAGVVIIAAAGNHGDVPGGDPNPEYYPALLDHVIGVAAVGDTLVKWPLSNYDSKLAISAPGVSIYSTVPGGLYAEWSGTSMSAAFVSGTAADIVARHPEWPGGAERVARVRATLSQSALDISAQNAGQLWSGQIGDGLLDADAAMRLDCLAGIDPCAGDTNCDGSVNAFDIQPFVTALTSKTAYENDYPNCEFMSADCNIDGTVNAFDIQPFVAQLMY